MAVLPAPSTVKPEGGSVTWTSSPTGISLTPSPIVNAGVCVAGTEVSR